MGQRYVHTTRPTNGQAAGGGGCLRIFVFRFRAFLLVLALFYIRNLGGCLPVACIYETEIVVSRCSICPRPRFLSFWCLVWFEMVYRLFIRPPLSCLPPDFRKIVEEYTADEELFFKDFAAAFAKLISLGTKSQPAGTEGGVYGLLQQFLAMIGMK